MNPLHERIRKRIEDLGTNPEAVSRRAGLDKTYLRKMFERPQSSPRQENLERIAWALEMDPADLLSSRKEAAREEWGVVTGDAGHAHAHDVRMASIRPPDRERMPNDVPVMGTAAGSHMSGAFQFQGVVDWVRRPPAVAGASGVYSLFIEGTSMEPEHHPGDLRFVHPHKPPRIGDSVIVQTRVNGDDNGIEAMIGHLVRRTGEFVFIGKLNPEATVRLRRADIVAIHKVLTLNELFGI